MLASIWSEWSEATHEVLVGLGGFATGAAVLALLGKGLLKQLFKKDLQAYKAKLEIEVAKAKNDIDSQSTRQLEMWIPLLIAASHATAQVPKVPAGRHHHSGVYDEARKEFLIYGGYTWDQGEKKLGDVWGWNGTSWRLVGDTGVRKIVAPLAFDSKQERTVMFGGSGASPAFFRDRFLRFPQEKAYSGILRHVTARCDLV